MKKILLIDTSEAKCSVAMAENGVILREISSGDEGQIASSKSDHSEKLALYIEELLKEYREYDAVAVNVGPGSYTGLRIGLSTAKGLCYGANKPLIAVDSLRALVEGALMQDVEMEEGSVMMPMIDARRMEVYLAKFDNKGMQLTDVQPVIVNEETLINTSLKYYIFGSGASKCIEQLTANNVNFTLLDFPQSAASMAKIAERKLALNETQDVAYIEPFYLKEWQPAVPQKKKN